MDSAKFYHAEVLAYKGDDGESLKMGVCATSQREAAEIIRDRLIRVSGYDDSRIVGFSKAMPAGTWDVGGTIIY